MKRFFLEVYYCRYSHQNIEQNVVPKYFQFVLIQKIGLKNNIESCF